MADFYFANGKAHPIRSSPGYDDAFVGLREADKQYLRGGTSSYTYTAPGRAERIAAAAALRAAGPRLGQRLAPYMADYAFRPKFKSRLY